MHGDPKGMVKWWGKLTRAGGCESVNRRGSGSSGRDLALQQRCVCSEAETCCKGLNLLSLDIIHCPRLMKAKRSGNEALGRTADAESESAPQAWSFLPGLPFNNSKFGNSPVPAKVTGSCAPASVFCSLFSPKFNINIDS